MKHTPDTLQPCLCGTMPTISNSVGILTKGVGYFYKCPNCGRKDNMSWPKETSVELMPSWNLTLSSITNHASYKGK